jgi:hypothetical protein
VRWAAFLLAVALGLGGSLAFAGFGFGQISFTVRIGTESAEVGEQVEMQLDIVDISGDLGVGAWKIDVTYNPEVVSVAACVPHNNSLCETERAHNVLRVLGASAVGLFEDFSVGTITFRCDAPGPSPLAVTYESGIGIPEIVADITTVNGGVICREPSEPTAAQPPTPTAGPLALPATGAGGTAGSGTALRLLAALAGLAAVSLVATLRLRARSRSLVAGRWSLVGWRRW